MVYDASAPARGEPQVVLARDYAWKSELIKNVSSPRVQHGKMLHIELGREENIFKPETSVFNPQRLLQLDCYVFHCSETNKDNRLIIWISV